MPSESQRAWVLSFCSQKGGVGKSTLARALATYLARRGATVKMVDADIQQSALEWNVTRRGRDAESVLDIAAANTSDDMKGMLTGAAWIIIDAPGRASRTTLELAKLSHLVVQPTGGSFDDILPGERVFAELVKAGIPRERLAFALSRIDSDMEEKGVRDYLAEQGHCVIAGSLHNRFGYKSAQNSGRSVLETNFESLNQKARELVRGIIARLYAVHDPAGLADKPDTADAPRSRPARKERAA